MKTLDLLFIVDPLGQLKQYKDTSVAMMREATRRGHRVWVCEVPEIRWQEGVTTARVHHLEVSDGHDWYSVQSVEDRPLSEFDAVLMRKDPPFDVEYLAVTWLLEHAEREGARVFNSPRALRDMNEKFAITEFAQFIAPTLVTRDMDAVRRFYVEQGDIVVKPLDGMGGTGVFRLRAGDPNLNSILETLSHNGARSVMAQRYLPAIVDGDKRVLLIGGKAVPHALARIPKPGESRGNLAAGGTARAQLLSAADQRIADALGPVLAERGLLLVGLDVIGENLTEVNVTSPTGFVEITTQTGFNVAGMFIDALEVAVAA
ncbi:MAG: glutathione synthase [Burkholderiaceae bacterium]